MSFYSEIGDKLLNLKEEKRDIQEKINILSEDYDKNKETIEKFNNKIEKIDKNIGKLLMGDINQFKY